jgi:SSS family solute:Na+ symporter
VTLVGAFIPLVAGVYWRHASTQGALASSIGGLLVWLGAENLAADAMIPPQLIGLAAAALLMVMGSLAPQLIERKGHPVAV